MNQIKQQLLLAQAKTKELFDIVYNTGLIMPGKSEKQLSAEIVDIAAQLDMPTHWHKKIVRCGVNTLAPYTADPSDLVIQEDDIVFFDFGPIYKGYETDFGRTFVIGNDPLKLKLKKDIEDAWQEANDWYFQQTKLTGAAYFSYLEDLAKRYGWEFGGEIGGHIIGPFPHEQLGDGNWGLDVHPNNQDDIFLKDPQGNDRHWVLEIQFVDRKKGIGGFFEQLLGE